MESTDDLTDPFGLLGLPRRPLLSEETIGTAYRRSAAILHPDQPGGDARRFRMLGEAASILREPARRLRFLSGTAGTGALPPEAADLFPRIAALLRKTDAALARHATASSPLAKAVLADPLRKAAGDLDALLTVIGEWQVALDVRLAALDARWPEHDPAEMSSLADSYTYATRWAFQLRERKLSLECA